MAKVAIIFYSFSDNTKRACEFLKEKLSVSHEVELAELILKHPERSFFRQGNAARKRQAPELANRDFDVAKYDFVIFASPVWVFTFTPAMRTYLKLCSGLQDKKTAVFLTCGAAFTSGRALEELKETVQSKKAQVQFSAYVAGAKTGNSRYLEHVFNDLLGLA